VNFESGNEFVVHLPLGYGLLPLVDLGRMVVAAKGNDNE